MNMRKIKGGDWFTIPQAKFDEITKAIDKNINETVLKTNILQYINEKKHIVKCNYENCGEDKIASYESRGDLGKLLLHYYTSQDSETKIIIDDRIMARLKEQIEHWDKASESKNKKYNQTDEEDGKYDEARNFG